MKTKFLLPALLSLSVITNAQVGAQDPSFGTNGVVRTSFLTESFDGANAIAIQTDGKIIVGGNTVPDNNSDFALVRYNTDGSLDNSFNGNGKVTTVIDANNQDYIDKIILQPDGKILAIGNVDLNVAMVRYNSNGSIDQSFGTNGIVNTKVGQTGGYVSSAVLQSDGKILIAGGFSYAMSITRFSANGSIDPTFGTNGTFVVDSATGSSNNIEDIALQNDGKILAAGTILENSVNSIFSARINSNGTIDGSYGTNGKVKTAIFTSTESYARAVNVQADGKVLLSGGTTYPADRNSVLVRYNANGTLDPSFGIGGITVLAYTDLTTIAATTLQSDGKIVSVGFSGNYFGVYKFAVWRIKTNGTLDSTFATNGAKIMQLGLSSANYSDARGVAIQSDGKIVVTGEGEDATGRSRFMTTRLMNTPGTGIAQLETTAVNVWPNPTTNVVNISHSLEVSAAGELTVSNYAGQIIHAQNIVLQPNNNLQLDCSKWAAGIYTLDIILPTQRLYGKIVKQ